MALIFQKYNFLFFLRFFMTVVFFISSRFLFAQESDRMDALEGLPITEIQIKTRRVRTELVRKIIPVKKGEIFNKDQIEKIRERLYRMKFFKKTAIRAVKDVNQNGVIISLDLEDGWFIFPLPFYSGGGGGTNGSLMLVERNIFKNAETLYLFGSGNREGSFGLLGFQFERFNLSVNYAQRSFKEWNYFDGGYNSAGSFRSSADEDHPEKYGWITNQYERKTEGGGFMFRLSSNEKTRMTLGFQSQGFHYSNSTVNLLPQDEGKSNMIVGGIGFRFGNGTDSVIGQGSFFQDFGAIFKFGMADLHERIKPLDKIQKQFNTELSVNESNQQIGSDFNSTILNLGMDASVTLKNRLRVALRARGSAGVRENLPHGQKIISNRDLALRGNYAREFRGDRGAGSTLNFVYPFRRTQRGVWTGNVFGDLSTVWNSGRSYCKEGIGLGFTYQFWRFPLPFGFIYSYSIDDRDNQVNFSFGGRF